VDLHGDRRISAMRKRPVFSLFLVALNAMAQQPAPQPPAAEPVPAQQQPASPANDEFSKAVFFGKKFFEMKDYAAAYQQFAKADQLQADHPGVLYDMALLLAKGGRYSEAQAKLDRYNQLYPNGTERALVSKLQLELEFQRELQKNRQADQDYGELFTRGRFLYGKNDLPAALKMFQDAEQKRPNDPAAVFNEAVIYEKLGDFARAAERFHRYEELEPNADQKNVTDQRILSLESELADIKSKIVCAFCGFRLPIGAVWCPHCWHGPYLTSSPVWNSRPCAEGATATRATYFADDRFAKNDGLPCLFSGTVLDALRYTPARQKSIQEARKAEGWTYNGEIIQGWRDEIRFVQGADYLEKIVSPTGGEILQFTAHRAADSNIWLLDREDTIIDGQKYTSRYTFDASNRIVQQQVDYQNAAGCGHVISMTADYAYQNDVLTAVKIKGGYEGYVVEGSPHVDWQAAIAYTYDSASRVVKEDLAMTSFNKMYNVKPYGAQRDELGRIYPTMRVKRPLENVSRSGDLCATAGNLLLGNPIDLRPFYALSPNLAMQIGYGVARASVSFTYPDAFKVR
jgi:tetratricopeptide (TPR) repeat protein